MQRAVGFKVTPEQFDLIKRIAAEQGMTPGQFARYSALQSVNLRTLESRIEAAQEDIKSEIISETKTALKKVAEFIIQNRKG